MNGIKKDSPKGGGNPVARGSLEAAITRMTPPEKTAAAPEWSVETKAKAIRTSKATVQRVWRDNGQKPHLIKSFNISNDNKFAEKLVDVVGLYLSRPENALVRRCDYKCQIQALDRTQNSRPMFPGRKKTFAHECRRNGMTTLLAAIELIAGRIVAERMPCQWNQE